MQAVGDGGHMGEGEAGRGKAWRCPMWFFLGLFLPREQLARCGEEARLWGACEETRARV